MSYPKNVFNSRDTTYFRWETAAISHNILSLAKITVVKSFGIPKTASELLENNNFAYANKIIKEYTLSLSIIAQQME